MIFDRIVGPTREQPGNGGPPVSVAGVCSQDGLVLGLRERTVLDAGAELVAPPKPARLARAALDVAANQGPIPGPVALDKPGENPVLLGAPRALDSLSLVGITGL